MNLEENKTGHPFKTPESYFNELEDRILSEVKLQNSIGRTSPFKAEPDFFSRLEQEILAKTTDAAPEEPVIHISHKKSYTRWIRIAAGVLILSTLGMKYYNQRSSAMPGINDLSREEMIAYLETQPLSSSEIASLIDPDEFSPADVLPDNLEIDENDVYFETSDI